MGPSLTAAALLGPDVADALVTTYADFDAGVLDSADAVWVASGDGAVDVVRAVLGVLRERPDLRLSVQLPAADPEALATVLAEPGPGLAGVVHRGGCTWLLLDGSGAHLTAATALDAVGVDEPEERGDGDGEAVLLRRLAVVEESARLREVELAALRESAEGLRRRNRRLRAQLDELRGDEGAGRAAAARLHAHRALLAGGGAVAVLLAVVVALAGSTAAGAVATGLAVLTLCAVVQTWMGLRTVHALARDHARQQADIERRIRLLDRQQRDAGEAIDDLATAVRIADERQTQAVRDVGARIALAGRGETANDNS